MRSPITIFHTGTGEILWFRYLIFGQEPIIMIPFNERGAGGAIVRTVAAADQDWIQGMWDRGLYKVDLATRKAIEKPTFAVTITGNQISGLPLGTKIIIDNGQLDDPVDSDGIAVIEVDYPQTVHMTLQHPLYLPLEQVLSLAPAQA